VVRLFIHLAALPQFQRHHLVLGGKPWPDDLRALVQGSELAARIHEWTELANEDLRALYSSAEALLFPSLQEGFGWPIAEAQACGCPVITTGRPPMSEVGGNAAVYINPDDMGDAADRVANALASRESLTANGLKNAERFAGATMAAGYVGAYQQVLAD
jgi:glycosyltransferase involved in cell wall biosynthesis